MAITHSAYDAYKLGRLRTTPSIGLVAGAIKVALVGAGYTPNLRTHDFWDDVQANELPNGSGYTTGGIALATKSDGIDPTTFFAYFYADPAVWLSFTSANIRYAVIYLDSGVASTSPLISLIDFGSVQSIAAGQFTLAWVAPASGGVLKIG